MTNNNFWHVPAPHRRTLRSFGLLMAGVAVAAAAYAHWRATALPAPPLLALAGALAAAGLAAPRALGPFYTAWMVLGKALGWLNSYVLLTVVYYTLFTGIGLIMRLVGYDPLDRVLQPRRESYWHKPGDPLPDRDHYERQF